jgi:hypothetical protein
MKTHYPVLTTLILILAITLAFSSTSCDRLVNITGKVYIWTNPPKKATSLIFHKEISPTGILKEDLPNGLELQPLKDVKVSSFGQFKDETFYSNEITDEEGKFKLIISLGYKTDSYDATIQAQRPGFMTVKRLITDVGPQHWITIVLVADSPAEEIPTE